MAGPSFYGEVLPLSSRAVDDDEDEQDADVQSFRTSIVRWTPTVSKEIEVHGHIECTTLIIAVGPVATAFSQTYFLHRPSEVIGVICSGLEEGSVNTFSQTAPTDRACFIHRLVDRPEVLLCQCNLTVAPDQAYSWVSQVFASLSRQSLFVAAMATAPVSDYKTASCPSSELPTPFLRLLKSNSCHGGAVACPYLEQPNVVDGLPAQVLSHCQINRVPAVLYVCYTENAQFDIATVKEFVRVCAQSPFRDIYVENPQAGEQLRKIADQSSCSSLLYM